MVKKLSKEVVLLKTTTAPDILESSSPCVQQKLSQEVQSTSTDASKEIQPATVLTLKQLLLPGSLTTEKPERKYNVVVYGIKECGKGTPRQEWLNHDLDKVTLIVTEGENSINPLSIHDLLRLGKYREQSKQPLPILVKLNRTIDVSLVLSKSRFLPKEIRIKPDMSQKKDKLNHFSLKRYGF